jgi:hypothetical protein
VAVLVTRTDLVSKVAERQHQHSALVMLALRHLDP